MFPLLLFDQGLDRSDVQLLKDVENLLKKVGLFRGVISAVNFFYSIILLTENTQKRGLLALPGLFTRYTLARHLKSVRIRVIREGPPSNKARSSKFYQLWPK